MYKVEINKSTIKALSKLPQQQSLRILKKIKRLESNPRPNGVVKLTGSINEYGIRIGDFRVLYLVEDHILKVLVLKIGNRRDIYK